MSSPILGLFFSQTFAKTSVKRTGSGAAAHTHTEQSKTSLVSGRVQAVEPGASGSAALDSSDAVVPLASEQSQLLPATKITQQLTADGTVSTQITFCWRDD